MTTDAYEEDAVDFGDIDPREESKGAHVDKDGWYHFCITNVKRNLDVPDTKTPDILFRCEVMATKNDQSPVGSVVWHRIYPKSKGGQDAKEGSKQTMARFGRGLGLIRTVVKDGVEKYVHYKTGESRMPLSMWDDAKGAHFIAKVTMESDPGYKPKPVFRFGEVFHPYDPSTEGQPRDIEALHEDREKVMELCPFAVEDSPVANAPSAQTAAPSSNDDDDLGDL